MRWVPPVFLAFALAMLVVGFFFPAVLVRPTKPMTSGESRFFFLSIGFTYLVMSLFLLRNRRRFPKVLEPEDD